MVEDVRLSLEGMRPVHFHGRFGGAVPEIDDVLEKVRSIAKGEAK